MNESSGRPFAPVDESERELALARTPPGLTRIADGTWSVGLRTVSRLVPTSFAYFLRDADGDLHVIDPGTDDEPNWLALTNAIQTLGGEVRSIAATHLHPDHLGMAARLHDASGAPTILARIEQQAFDEPAGGLGEAVLDAWGVPADRRQELLELPRIRGRRGEFHADALVDDGATLDIPADRST